MNLADTFASWHVPTHLIVNFLPPPSSAFFVSSTLTWIVQFVKNKEADRCSGRLFQVPFKHVVFVLDQAYGFSFGLYLYFMSLSRCFSVLLRSMHFHLALIRHVLEGVHPCYVLQILVGSPGVIRNTFHRADSQVGRHWRFSPSATDLIRITLFLFLLAQAHCTRPSNRRWCLVLSFLFSNSSLREIRWKAQPGLIIVLWINFASSAALHALIWDCYFFSWELVRELSFERLVISAVLCETVILDATFSLSWCYALICLLRD